MKYPIYDTKGEVLFEAEIDCRETTPDNYKKRLAVQWAVSNEQSMADADLRIASLSVAKLRYANLHGANLRSADLQGAKLHGADLRGTNLINADLRNASLRNADLCGADLSGANLCKADLHDTNFYNTNFEGVILPFYKVKIRNIHQKVYEAASQLGALKMNKWYSCNTTYGRAGWVVYLAGETGYELKKVYGTAVAALIIYRASDPDYHEDPDFYAPHTKALDDMKRLAEQERIQ